MRTRFPSLATSAKEPSIPRTSSAVPLRTRERASSAVMLRMRLAEGSVRSTRRSMYSCMMGELGRAFPAADVRLWMTLGPGCANAKCRLRDERSLGRGGLPGQHGGPHPSGVVGADPTGLRRPGLRRRAVGLVVHRVEGKRGNLVAPDHVEIS